MLSDERVSARLPTNIQSGSYRDAPMSRGYQQQASIAEEDERDHEYENGRDDIDQPNKTDQPVRSSQDQYIEALRYRFRSRPKSDYVYSKPLGPSVSTNSPPFTNAAAPPPPPPPPQPSSSTERPRTQGSGPYQSTIRPNTGSTNVSETSDDKPFLRPALRRVNPDQQNTYARRIINETTTSTPTSQSQPQPVTTSGGQNVRINEQGTRTNPSTTSTFARQSSIPPQTHESIFEKIPSHGGPVSYLGTGTFSQFEHCLRECLERERRQTGVASHVTRYDYGYGDVSTSRVNDVIYPTTSTSHIIDYPLHPSATFLLDDIRHINVALSRSGIPIFPHEQSYPNPYPSSIPIVSPGTVIHSPYPSGRRVIGEVVSACRLVEDDPALLHHTTRSEAVQNVWNAIQQHQPFSYLDVSNSSLSPRGPL